SNSSANAGILVSSSTVQIYKNYIHNCQYGVRLQTGSSADIHDNDLYANEFGLFLEQSQPSNLKWNNFGYTSGSPNYNTAIGMIIYYLTSGNNFMAQKWNNFYDGNNIGIGADVLNSTANTLVATGQYWRNQSVSGPINVSSPQASHNSNAGPGGSTGKEPPAPNEPIAPNPSSFVLAQNFPNPFNPSTKIQFALPERAIVSLAIYDLNGHLVRQLVSQQLFESGRSEWSWDGRNEQGFAVSSGIYVYRLQAQGLDSNASFTQTRRLVLMQ
ncbi:MAG: FlgD immunoglobulin-like domain containing protein, partial [bacterium]